MILILFGFISYFEFDAFCVFFCMYILIFMFLYIPTYNVDEMTRGFLKILKSLERSKNLKNKLNCSLMLQKTNEIFA